MYDVVIIGAGPAGISAGIYAASRGKKTLILEKKEIGGLIGKVSTVTHYAGIITGETGVSFAERLKEQAKQAGVEVRQEEVISVELSAQEKKIHTEQGMYDAKKVILANGTSPRKLGITGEEELSGRGMGMNAAKDASAYCGKHVYVVGGADGAVKEALYLAGFAEKVTILHFEETLGCIAEFREKAEHTSNVEVRLHSRLHAVYGVEKVESLEILDERTGAIETVAVPNTELYTQIQLENGFIPVDENMQTEIPGVYAVGDIRVKQVRQVSTAVADGTIAAIHAAR